MGLVDINSPEYRNLDPRVIAEAERISAEMAPHIAPAGTMGLPKLLDDRRLEYDIPNGAFWGDAVFDRVLVYQIDRARGDKFENSLLHRPDISKAREREECPIGIVVSAGLSALDSLRSHGIDLGHKVLFVHLAPFRFQCDTVDGKPVYVLVLRAGDIIASQDLLKQRNSGEVKIEATTVDGAVVHRLVGRGSTQDADIFADQ